MKTFVVCHFYNESYLLPYWLNHHKNIFDHGIMINYKSTDNSVSLIQSIVPGWKIIDSVNENFQAADVDQEVMRIESECIGIKICLNVTEFLFCKNLSSHFDMNSNQAYAIERFTMVQKWDFFKFVKSPLWKSRYFGYAGNNNINGVHRFIHNYGDGQYTVGRHSTTHDYNIMEDAIILWYGFSPFNSAMVKRKLQIKYRIPKSDFLNGYGFQHNVGFLNLFKSYLSQLKHNKVINLKNKIESFQ